MKHKILHIISYHATNICRMILALVFVFSGFVKAVDPLGTTYKLEEYLMHWGLFDIPLSVCIGLAVMLSTLEFILGIYLLFGIRRKFTALATFVFVSCMLLLTIYIVIAEPVADCGCFGDAIHLTNRETFVKNIFLFLASCMILRRPLFQFRFISERNQWLVSTYSFVYILFFSAWSLYYLPVLDFRPYHIGVNIQEASQLPSSAKLPVYETDFIFEKNGKQQHFKEENYPDSTWTFVDSKTKLISAGDEPKIKDFFISDLLTGDDVTDKLLADSLYAFWIISPDLEEVEDYPIDGINEIHDYCVDHGYSLYCITSSDHDACVAWQDRIGVYFPILQADKTLLKTIVRSNPGLLLVKNGSILNKWSKHDFPVEEQLNGDLEQMELVDDEYQNRWFDLLKMLSWYIIPLLFITLADRIWIGSKYYKRYKLHKLILTNKKRQ